MRISCLIALCLFLDVVAVAQSASVTLVRETPLYEMPNPASIVRTRLAPGTRVDVLSERPDWLAVATPQGLTGWLRRADLDSESTEDTGELIRSIRELAAEGGVREPTQVVDTSTTTQASVPPPSPTEAAPTVPPPPPTTMGSTPQREGGRTGVPPPPRPPSQVRGSLPGAAPDGRGAYGASRWLRLSGGADDFGTATASLDAGFFLGRFVELEVGFAASMFDEADPPGAGLLREELDLPYGTLAPAFAEPPQLAEPGAALRLHYVRPRNRLVMGLTAAVIGSYAEVSGESIDGTLDRYSRVRAGAEFGTYIRRPGRATLIVGASTRITGDTYTTDFGDEVSVSETAYRSQAFIEIRLGPVVPGMRASIDQNDRVAVFVSLALVR